MSSPIKPPGGPSSGPSGIEPGSEEARVDDAGFADEIERARAEGHGVVDDVTEPAEAGPIGEVVADVRAGRLDVEGALDRLVERALERASGLPASHRAALEAQLREALSEDPTLVALRRDLERASTT